MFGKFFGTNWNSAEGLGKVFFYKIERYCNILKIFLQKCASRRFLKIFDNPDLKRFGKYSWNVPEPQSGNELLNNWSVYTKNSSRPPCDLCKRKDLWSSIFQYGQSNQLSRRQRLYVLSHHKSQFHWIFARKKFMGRGRQQAIVFKTWGCCFYCLSIVFFKTLGGNNVSGGEVV